MADQLGGATGNATASDLLTGYTASTQNGVISGSIPIVAGGNTITPSTVSQTAIGAAEYATNAISVAGDANLVPSNIANGKTIFNVAGTALLATGNATAADLLSGYTASTGSGSISGTMPENGSLTATSSESTQTFGGGHYSGITINPIPVARGSVTSSAAMMQFIEQGGTQVGQYGITVSGLGFTPSKIFVYPVASGSSGGSSDQCTTVVDTAGLSGAYQNAGILLCSALGNGVQGYNSYEIDGTHAYVNSGGFQLPVVGASMNYEYLAIG